MITTYPPVGARLDSMGDLDVAARRRLVAVAGHRGDEPTAKRHLSDPEPVVRATALRALRRAGTLDTSQLTLAIDDPSPVVRKAAAGVIASAPSSIPARELQAGLSRLLDDPDAGVCEAASWATGERPAVPAPLIAQLVTLVADHDDALVREAAVAALGAIGDPAGKAAVLAATNDKATVRRRAVLALASFEGTDVDEALQRALGDRDRQVRQAAEDLLET